MNAHVNHCVDLYQHHRKSKTDLIGKDIMAAVGEEGKVDGKRLKKAWLKVIVCEGLGGCGPHRGEGVRRRRRERGRANTRGRLATSGRGAGSALMGHVRTNVRGLRIGLAFLCSSIRQKRRRERVREGRVRRDVVRQRAGVGQAGRGM